MVLDAAAASFMRDRALEDEGRIFERERGLIKDFDLDVNALSSSVASREPSEI